jgi:predicted HAD superfamily hydrolase
MKVFYINLDRRPERRIHLEEELSRAGIHDEEKERIPAVDGRTLDLNCPQIRSLFSAQVLKEAQEEGFDHEVTLTEILGRTLDKLSSRDLLDAWIAYELEAEIGHLRAKLGAIDMLRRLKEAKKTVVLTSDMYLERDHLERILGSAGRGGKRQHDG